MTRQLTAKLKRKARIIHGQILGTELLVKECGGDVEQAVERHFEMLHDIYAEEFLLAALTDSSDLLLLYEGNAISSEALPLTFFSSKMREISSALTKVARTTVSLNHAAGHKRPSNFDPRFSGMTIGDLFIGVRVPRPEQNADSDMTAQIDQTHQAVRAAISSLEKVAGCINGETLSEDIKEEFPDPAMLDTALVAAHRLAPKKQKYISQVTLINANQDGTQPSPLTQASRGAIENFMQTSPERMANDGCFEGVVHNIDLADSRFEVCFGQANGTAPNGTAPNSTAPNGTAPNGTTPIRCIYDRQQIKNAKDLANQTVKITGSYATSPDGQPRLMAVDDLVVA